MKEISLGSIFSPTAIRVNDMTLLIDSEGRPTLEASGDATIITEGNIKAHSINGNVTAYTNGTVQHEAPAPEQTPTESGGITATVTKKAYNIGDVLPDGWVVGPVSPDTGIVMKIEPEFGALRGYKIWKQGEDHAAALRGKGHDNARQPSTLELSVIYSDIVKAGHNHHAQFETRRNGHPHSMYWSGTTDDRNHVSVKNFHDGHETFFRKNTRSAACVRCVADAPPGIKLK